MEENKMAGYLSIVLGLIFIIFPMFSAGLVSIIVGLSLLFFGISAIFTGWNMKNEAGNSFPIIILAIGIIAVIFGFLFAKLYRISVASSCETLYKLLICIYDFS